MNDFEEPKGDNKVQWRGETEVNLPSDCYSSDSGDESDAEVPDVTDPVLANYNRGQGTEDVNRASRLTPASVNSTSVASSSRRGHGREIDIGQGWKPGLGGENKGLKESVPMQTSIIGLVSTLPPSKQQTNSDKSKAPLPANASADKVKLDGNDSDSDLRRVPELSAMGAGSSHAEVKVSSGPSSKRRGGPSADKEHKRLKRLLRNRVSAQQARERKKAYLSDLEIRSKELEHRNAELEERVSTLQRENQMLRQIVKNTALKKSGPVGGSMGGAQ